MKINEIKMILQKHRSQPVGTGIIDCITSWEDIKNLVDELILNDVIIERCSWWCHCTLGNKQDFGCPHGMGGPRSKYYEGWFSETQLPMTLFDDNKEILPYLLEMLLKEEWYSPCLVPGLWLLEENAPRRFNGEDSSINL